MKITLLLESVHYKRVRYICFTVYERYVKLKPDYYASCPIDFRFYFDLWNGIHYCLYCLASEKEGNCLLSREPAPTTDVHCQVWYSFQCQLLSFIYPSIHTPFLKYLFLSSIHLFINWFIHPLIHVSVD